MPSHHITITNNTITLYCDAIRWEEEQSCNPAIREVPLRGIEEESLGGEYVDVGTFTIDNRKLTFIIRLTDSERTTLKNILNTNTPINIIAKVEDDQEYPQWRYAGWLLRVLHEYKYRVSNSNIFEWEIELEFYCSGFGHYINPIQFDEPLDWGYFKNKGEIWFNQESGGYLGYPIYVTDPFAEQGGGYFNR